MEQQADSFSSEMSSSPRSNAASAVGHRVSLLRTASDRNRPRGGKGTIIAYNPETNQHTVKFDQDGREESMILNSERFKWLVQEAEPADSAATRLEKAILNDLAGRKIKVFSKKFSKKRNRWYHGTVIEYVESKRASTESDFLS